MTTAVYVRNTRKGRRVVSPIKTNIIGRKKLRPFKTVAELITVDESFAVAKLILEMQG